MNRCLRNLSYLLVSVLSLAAMTVSAQAVLMDASVGFNSIAKSGVWTPIVVQLVNPESDEVSGTLLATETDALSGVTPLCMQKVVLPAKSAKLYHLYARLGDYGDSVTVALMKGGGVAVSKKVKYTEISEDDTMVVSVGQRSSRLYFLSGETIKKQSKQKPNPYSAPGAPGSGLVESSIQVGSIEPAQLPDRPAAYEGIDLLLAGEISPSSTDPKALQAISMWVAAGGTLVVSAGANVANFHNSFYDELLPVNITGTANLPDLNALFAAGGSAFPAGAVSVAKSSVKPGIGSIILASNGVPIIAERSYGAGHVIFLALDCHSAPFSNWNGQIDFWKTIALGAKFEPLVATYTGFPEERNYYDPDYAGLSTLSQVVAANPRIQIPSTGRISIFLLAYLVMLVPVNYFVLSRKKRLELAWVTTPAIVLVFTVGAYAIGYTMKGGKIEMTQATILEGSSDSRYVRAVTESCLFSPARRSYDIQLSDPYAIAQPLIREKKERFPEMFIGEQTTIEKVPMAMWSSKDFESVSGADLGGKLESRLVLEGNKIRGQILNKTKMSLKDCVVVCGSVEKNIGNIGPGKSANIDLVMLSSAAFNPGAPQNELSGGPDVEVRLGELATHLAKSRQIPYLVARVERIGSGFTVVSKKASVKPAEYCALRLGFTVKNSFTISPGSMKSSLIKVENADRYSDYNSNATSDKGTLMHIHDNGSYVVNCITPALSGGTITALAVQFEACPMSNPNKMSSSAYNSMFKFWLYNYKTGQYDPVQPFKPVSAATYLAPNNEVKLKVKQNGLKAMVIAAGISAEGVGR